MGEQHPLQLPLIISHLQRPLAHPLETDHSWKVSADFAISWLWRSKNEKYYFRLIIRQIMKISFFSGWIASPFGYLSNQVDGIVDRSAFPRHSYRVWAGSSARTPSKGNEGLRLHGLQWCPLHGLCMTCLSAVRLQWPASCRNLTLNDPQYSLLSFCTTYRITLFKKHLISQ